MLSVWDRLVQLRTERKFQTVCQQLGEGLTPEILRQMAEADASLIELMRLTGKTIPTHQDNPGVRYLQSCSDEFLFGLMEQAVPQHAQVIARYPSFQQRVIRELKELAKNQNTGG